MTKEMTLNTHKADLIELSSGLRDCDWPRFDKLEITKTGLVLSIYIPDDLSYFQGHFPEQPVVPGVVQIHWVGEIAKRYFSSIGFVSLRAVKFGNVILPGMVLNLTLDYQSKKHTFRFEYSDEKTSYSSGLIICSSSDLG